MFTTNTYINISFSLALTIQFGYLKNTKRKQIKGVKHNYEIKFLNMIDGMIQIKN